MSGETSFLVIKKLLSSQNFKLQDYATYIISRKTNEAKVFLEKKFFSGR
jgi:hypothetical protein